MSIAWEDADAALPCHSEYRIPESALSQAEEERERPFVPAPLINGL